MNMRACDICPGGAACAGVNLAPVLVRVLDLYAGGKTDKFEILFALDEDEVEIDKQERPNRKGGSDL